VPLGDEEHPAFLLHTDGIAAAGTFGVLTEPERIDELAPAAGPHALPVGKRRHEMSLRHTFVSLHSDDGVATKKISDLISHHSTAVTETVYRHQLQPVIENGAERMQDILARLLNTSSSPRR
jgi:hypothetical protein